MPLTFLNGGGPDFAGQPVGDGNAILTNIKTTLETAGWTTATDNIQSANTDGQFIVMQCTSLIGSITVYYRFMILDNSANIAGGYKLTIAGSTIASFVSNTSDEYTLDYIDFNTDSRLWITADDETFAICLISFASLAGGVHGGFLNRIEPQTDIGGYCIGYILSNIQLKYSGYQDTTGSFYQIGQDAHAGRQWYEVIDAFYWRGFDQEYTGTDILPIQGFFDRYTTCLVPFESYIETSQNNAAFNAGYNAQNGNVNGVDDKAVLGEWFVTEGRNNINDYATPGLLQTPLYYRGSTKFNVVGMASFAAGIQVEDTIGRRYLSVGPVGWAGQRIS